MSLDHERTEERALRARLQLEAPPPRRTDAAFAHGVAEGLAPRRGRFAPAVVAVSAALALAVFLAVGERRPLDPPAAAPEQSLAALDDEDLLGLDDDDGLYAAALPAPETLDDEELLAFAGALDAALVR